MGDRTFGQPGVVIRRKHGIHKGRILWRRKQLFHLELFVAYIRRYKRSFLRAGGFLVCRANEFLRFIAWKLDDTI